MNNELTEKLYAEFPYLYRGRSKPPDESSMCWGFECGDGWFELIRELSLALTNHLAKDPTLDLEVMQVKAKFGSLRYSVDGGNALTETIIGNFRERASHVCELTGREGILCVGSTAKGRRFGSLHMILCDEKAKELGYLPAE